MRGKLSSGLRFNGSANEESQENADLRRSLGDVLKGLRFALIELCVSRHRGSVQIKAVIFNGSSIGTDDCTKVHRAIMPRLELAFPNQDIYLEVSSPGIDRLIKDGSEFCHYIGRAVRCYRSDITEWSAGILESVDENGIVIKQKEGALKLSFDIIAKAKLDGSQN
ncbi:MAG: ribosome assembly cofactor RimP [Treponema sp.]|nr:ribosome assembly cofactor RimP [Treponema sp.]